MLRLPGACHRRRRLSGGTPGCAAVVALLVAVVAASAVAAPGDLDRSFSHDGVTTLALARDDDAAVAVTLARDGDILVAARAEPADGYHSDFIIVRYRSDGSRDPGFGEHGVARVDFRGAWDAAGDLVEQTDGKIIVVGSATWLTAANEEREAVGVVRLLADGRRDPSFGAGGMVVLPRAAFSGRPECLGAGAVAIGRDGRIVLAGSVGCGGVNGDDDIRIAAARLLPDGRLDATFGAGGTLVTYAGCGVGGIIVHKDSSLLIGGQTGSWDYCFGGKMLLLRLRADGRLNRRWGDKGRRRIGFHGTRNAGAWAMATAPGHRVILAGFAGEPRNKVALARVHRDGRLDDSFSADGRATTRFDARSTDWVTGAAVGRHGSVSLAVESCLPAFKCRFGVARFRRDGQLDTSFSGDGRRILMFGRARSDAGDVAVDRRDRTIAVGSASRRRTRADFAIARLR